ncbi:hypothetical protein HPB50_003669 [Hyalomma asiaticum]|uniref:Uncharacterized protein n=1 Tax=Hyalomma asiaticum TaxID=266040 RepID=A0ACB7TEE3_HYAAI|nr:hypothetical protein HPB50_003669 [Hyalomma asiaticum]
MAYPEIQGTGVNAQGTRPNEELPSLKISDHVSKYLKDPTNDCRRRVGCDIREAKYNRILGELVYAQQNNTAKIHTLNLGPPGTRYDVGYTARATTPNDQLPLPSFWFLVSREREGPTGKWRRRAVCGIHKAGFYRVSGVFISAEHNNTTKIHAPILEPPGTPYRGNARARRTAPKHRLPSASSARRTAPNHQLPLPNFWCRVSRGHKGPTAEYWRCAGYCNREVQFYLVHKESSAEENTAKTSGLAIGPADTPYEAGDRAPGNTPKKQLRSAYFWDLISYEREDSTNEHRCRVGCGVRKAEFYRVARVLVAAEENDTAKIHALIMGPPGTQYEGGFFQFLLNCPPDNPDCPCRVRLMTTSAGRVRSGPRLYQNVTACLGHLGSLCEATWMSYRYLLNVIFLIKFLLTPEISVSQGSHFGVLPALGMWLTDMKCRNAVLPRETTLVAVYDAVEENLRTSLACPRYRRDEVVKHFPQYYVVYKRAVKSRVHFPDSTKKDSTQRDPSLYQFGTILERLAATCEEFNLLSKTAVG